VKRVVLWIVGVPVGLAVVAYGIGLAIPRDHVASLAIEFQAGPGQVWAIVTDFSGTPGWRPDVTAVRMEPSPGGPVRFTETSSQGDVTFEIVRQDPPRQQVVRVVDDDQPFGGTWTWTLEPAGTGTRLTVTERGFVKSPAFRVLAALFVSPTDTIDAYLRALATRLGETSGPVQVEPPRVD
jgi:hypothetical protein